MSGENAVQETLPRNSHMGPVTRELTKILFQKRTYVIWAGFLAVPIVMSLAIYLAGNNGHPEGNLFLSRITMNGLFVPLAALLGLSIFLLPVAAAMVAGYLIAGEAEIGTLRTILVRPVGRGSVLLAKWSVAAIYLVVILALVAAGGIVSGAFFFGLHPLSTLSGTTLSIGHSIGLMGLAYLLGLIGMLCVVSLALLLSTLTNSSLWAAGGTVALVIVVQLLTSFSYFDFLRPYTFPTHWDAWQNLFRTPIYWQPVREALINFGASIVVLTSLAWLVFRRKDILS
jgi:ABC-2 type transport system permease protein